MKFKKIFIFTLLIFTSLLLVACNGDNKKKTGPAVINDSGGVSIVIRRGDTFNPKTGITATDEAKGDVTDKITIEGSVNVNEPAIYNLTYKIVASDGEEYEYKKTVEVADAVFVGVNDRRIILNADSGFDVTAGVQVVDPLLGTLGANRNEHKDYFTITGEVNRDTVGDYQIVYRFTVGDYSISHIRIISVVNEITIDVPGQGNVERYEYDSPFNPLSGVTAYRPAETEKPLQAVDEEGNLIFDENGDPVYVQAKDDNGELLFDENGDPIWETITAYIAENVSEYIHVDGSVDTKSPGEYFLTYRIIDPSNPLEYLKDSEGNIVTETRTIEVYVRVEIRGIAPAFVEAGGSFDPMSGITGFDSVQGIVTDQIQVIGMNFVNLEAIGSYTITYVLIGSNNTSVQITRTINVIKPAEGPQQIVIMAGDVMELDPFHPDFSGNNAKERQDAQRAAEEKWNVKVVYKLYPSNAAWGNDRINAIIQASTAGEPLADIFYHVTTNWLGQLAGGGALAPINDYIGPGNAGEVLDQRLVDSGYLNGNYYAFAAGDVTLESGLYFNIDLLNRLGLDNPTELYLGEAYAADKAAGLPPEERSTADASKNWRWSDFLDWAIKARNALNGVSTGDDKYYTLGGTIDYYAKHTIPLNGGGFFDFENAEVIFGKPEAMEAFTFVQDLFNEELFEPNRGIDQGSAEWQSGKVLMHPGDLWFVKADNRWGKMQFDLGFVPFPMNDGYEGEYSSPIFGSGVSYLASGHTKTRNELAFNVWTDLQLWGHGVFTKDEAFRISLEDKFNDDIYIDAYMTVYDKAYIDFLMAFVSDWASYSVRYLTNRGIPENNIRAEVEASVGQYQYYLEEYLRGS